MSSGDPAVVVHGHFYQPPRENPWTGEVDRQPEAHPFHDWNERIYRECYRPNAYARIADGAGRIERIVNVYELISFDFGPTLLSWLERSHPGTYARILEADRRSARQRGGHGNALAHGYNHAILPLCNARDRRTQVRWGVADFAHRFGRRPEGFWLPETACNDETLGVLIEEGVRFTILSPYQARRVRPLGGPRREWVATSGGEVDPRLPYRYFHRDGSGRSLAIFFYDGPVSHAVAFEGILHSSKIFVDRLAGAGPREGRLVHVATDGETYGHHFRFGERCLAHALAVEAPGRGFRITNYGEFLEQHPPAHEVEIETGPGGEGTSWSCAHGVGRWARDCGCQAGGREGWNQSWRAPLRAALDFLRDQAARSFDALRGRLFEDPWAARDAYVELILDRGRPREEFLHRFASRSLSRGEQERALAFLEMQRHAMLMYTSCGWFFADVSGPETVQVLRYAGRVLDFLEELGQEPDRAGFLDRLAEARSNLPEMGTGADVYRRFVEPARVSAERVAAHLAIAGLAGGEESSGECAAHRFQKRSFRREQHGRLTLATGRLKLQTIATGRECEYATLALHLGGVDFYGLVKPDPGDERFRASAERLWRHFTTASLPTFLRIAQEEFGLNEYGFEHVLPDVRRTIIGAMFGSLIARLSEQYALLYEDNRRTLEMLQASGFDLPAELRAAAEFTLGRQFEEEIRRRGAESDLSAYEKAAGIAEEAARRGYRIDRSFANRLFGGRITEAVRAAVGQPSPERVREALGLIALSGRLGLDPPLERAQEIVYEALEDPLRRSDLLARLAAPLGLAPRAGEAPDLSAEAPGKAEAARPKAPVSQGAHPHE